MLDIKLIRENPDVVRDALRARQMDDSAVDALVRLDERRRQILSEVEELKAERNTVSKEIGKMKDADERNAKITAMREVGDKIKGLDGELKNVDAELTSTFGYPAQPAE
jgi:seryl-tRNA synthetase